MTFLMRRHDNRARPSMVTSIMPGDGEGCIPPCDGTAQADRGSAWT